MHHCLQAVELTENMLGPPANITMDICMRTWGIPPPWCARIHMRWCGLEYAYIALLYFGFMQPMPRCRQGARLNTRSPWMLININHWLRHIRTWRVATDVAAIPSSWASSLNTSSRTTVWQTLLGDSIKTSIKSFHATSCTALCILCPFSSGDTNMKCRSIVGPGTMDSSNMCTCCE